MFLMVVAGYVGQIYESLTLYIWNQQGFLGKFFFIAV